MLRLEREEKLSGQKLWQMGVCLQLWWGPMYWWKMRTGGSGGSKKWVVTRVTGELVHTLRLEESSQLHVGFSLFPFGMMPECLM